MIAVAAPWVSALHLVSGLHLVTCQTSFVAQLIWPPGFSALGML